MAVSLACVIAGTTVLGRHQLSHDTFEVDSDRVTDAILANTARRSQQLQNMLTQRKYAATLVDAQLAYLADGKSSDMSMAREALLRLGTYVSKNSSLGRPELSATDSAREGLIEYTRGEMTVSRESRSGRQHNLLVFVNAADSNRWRIDVLGEDPRIAPLVRDATIAGVNSALRASTEDTYVARSEQSASRVREARSSLDLVQARQFDYLKGLERERAELKIGLFRLEEEIRPLELREHISNQGKSTIKGRLAKVDLQDGSIDEELFNAISRRLAVLKASLKTQDAVFQELVNRFKHLSASHNAVKARITVANNALSAAGSSFNSAIAAASASPDRAQFTLAHINGKDGLIAHSQGERSEAEIAEQAKIAGSGLAVGVLMATLFALTASVWRSPARRPRLSRAPLRSQA